MPQDEGREPSPSLSFPPELEEIFRSIESDIPGFNADAVLQELVEWSASTPAHSELCAMHDQLWDHFSQISLTPTGDQRHVLLMASAWCATTFRHAHAAFLLGENGLADTARGNTRIALEHAIYLSLLAGTDNHTHVLDRLEVRFQAQWDRLIQSSRQLGEDIPDFVDLLLHGMPDVTPAEGTSWVRKVEQVCDRLETGYRVYDHYRMLSSEMHPGFGSAALYFMAAFTQMKRDDSSFPVEPIQLGTDMVLFLAVGACVWAGWSIDSLFGIDYFQGVVSDIAVTMSLSPLRVKAR